MLRQIITRPDTLLHPANLMTDNALVQCLAAGDLGLSKFFRSAGQKRRLPKPKIFLRQKIFLR